MTSKQKVFIFDFDGVLCDSHEEIFASLLSACSTQWPTLFSMRDFADFVKVYQKISDIGKCPGEILFCCFLAKMGYKSESIRTIMVCPNNELEAHCLDLKDLDATFHSSRNHFMTSHKALWLAKQPMYSHLFPTFKDLVAHAQASDDLFVYIATNKRNDYPLEILRCNGVDVEEQTVFGEQKCLKKVGTIKTLMKKHGSDFSYVFVEDRLGTLIACQEDEDLLKSDLKLVLTEYGYNSVHDHDHAKEIGIDVFSQESLAKFMKSSWESDVST
eukprot:TRINITY_DN776261_c0_g1_i1.p1 TRINITY_DN776261_c0_g1~~TRINITY_DN776261_c0_g1_i1.p1  ORF type:complete len:272 (+),score=60.87 TRINITY_DN776261_c0_g1_i1:83-898(+)